MTARTLHRLMVTGGGPFGRAWAECSCGWAQVFASKHAANRSAHRHHHEHNAGPCPYVEQGLECER